MYHCLNVVTEREDFPAAVLIRAVEIDGTLIDGPGRLCRTLDIDRSHNRIDLTSGKALWFEDRGAAITRRDIGQFPRIGVDYAGIWAKKMWRFRLRVRPNQALQ
jgi:DNA-3-methyladenine glycosylase